MNDDIANSIKILANSITANAAPSTDACNGHVASLTEAVMGITAALVMISSSLDQIAFALNKGEVK